MQKRQIMLPEVHAACDELKISPAIISGDHVFLSGITGAGTNGEMPSDPEAQFYQAFNKINTVLKQAGLSFADVVEMTSYHLDIGEHFEVFSEVRSDFVLTPYPAWTAVEVAGLRRAGALVEIKVIAQLSGRA